MKVNYTPCPLPKSHLMLPCLYLISQSITLLVFLTANCVKKHFQVRKNLPLKPLCPSSGKQLDKSLEISGVPVTSIDAPVM